MTWRASLVALVFAVPAFATSPITSCGWMNFANIYILHVSPNDCSSSLTK